MYTFLDLCSFCLKNKSYLELVDTSNIQGIKILKKINYLLTESDFTKDSQRICNDCKYKLDFSYKFKKMCLKNQEIFQTYTATLKNNIDPLKNKCGKLCVMLVDIKHKHKLKTEDLSEDNYVNTPTNKTNPVQCDQLLCATNKIVDYDDNIPISYQTSYGNTKKLIKSTSTHLITKIETENTFISELNKNKTLSISFNKKYYGFSMEEVLKSHEYLFNMKLNIKNTINELKNNEKYSKHSYRFIKNKCTNELGFNNRRNHKSVFKSSNLNDNKQQDVNLEPTKSFVNKTHSFVSKSNKDNTSEDKYSVYTNISSYKANAMRINHNFKIQDREQKQHNNDESKILKCSKCNRTFHRQSCLNLHLKVHDGTTPFKCNICSKFFAYKKNLKTHMLSHTSSESFYCTLCNKSFRRKNSLKRHMLGHSGYKPHRCKICDKSFSRRTGLKLHMFIHVEEKPFQCELCPKKFIAKTSFDCHLLHHQGIKPFSCDICDRRFLQKSHLKSHLKLIHKLQSDEIVNSEIASHKSY